MEGSGCATKQRKQTKNKINTRKLRDSQESNSHYQVSRFVTKATGCLVIMKY
jgi:hypothetical protein